MPTSTGTCVCGSADTPTTGASTCWYDSKTLPAILPLGCVFTNPSCSCSDALNFEVDSENPGQCKCKTNYILDSNQCVSITPPRCKTL